jgi:hypothetical protein
VCRLFPHVGKSHLKRTSSRLKLWAASPTRPWLVSLDLGLPRDHRDRGIYKCRRSRSKLARMRSPIDALDSVTVTMVKTWVLHALGAGFGLVANPATVEGRTWEDYKAHNRTPSTCPDYTDYSQERHKPYSNGSLALPYMRPSPECRTFNSSAVEVRQPPF